MEDRTSLPCLATWAEAGSAAKRLSNSNSVRQTLGERRDCAFMKGSPLLGERRKGRYRPPVTTRAGRTTLPTPRITRLDLLRLLYSPPDPKTRESRCL